MTAAWLDLLPWATPEELRALVESEHAAALYFAALGTAGIPLGLAFEPVAFEVLALVLAEVHGEVGRMLA